MATHSSISAWRIPWTEESSGLWDHKKLDTTEVTEHDTYQNLMVTAYHKSKILTDTHTKKKGIQTQH